MIEEKNSFLNFVTQNDISSLLSEMDKPRSLSSQDIVLKRIGASVLAQYSKYKPLLEDFPLPIGSNFSEDDIERQKAVKEIFIRLFVQPESNLDIAADEIAALHRLKILEASLQIQTLSPENPEDIEQAWQFLFSQFKIKSRRFGIDPKKFQEILLKLASKLVEKGCGSAKAWEQIVPHLKKEASLRRPLVIFCKKLMKQDLMPQETEGGSLEQTLASFVEYMPKPLWFEEHDYRVPNEGHPETIKESILDSYVIPGGTLVSTGSERSFFTIALADKGTFKRAIIRDINPQIKAYVDCNILLFRLSSSREEYKKLLLQNPEEKRRILQEKIETSSLSEAMKRYYWHQLPLLVEFQRVHRQWWLCEDFQEVNYLEKDELFWKIKDLADAGNIVATVGDIAELDSFNPPEISLIDTSNICDHSPIFFEGREGFHPVVVYTHLTKIASSRVWKTIFYRYILNSQAPEFDPDIRTYRLLKATQIRSDPRQVF